jgi:hypothetical protein
MMRKRSRLTAALLVAAVLVLASAAWAVYAPDLSVGWGRQVQIDRSGNAIFGGTMQAKRLQTVTSTSTSLTITRDYYGKTLLYSPTGAGTITLPANGSAPAGTCFDIIVLTDQTVTVAAATADTLITDGDLQADSVAFSTASHKIASHLRVMSNGSYWIADNVGGTTMTPAT